MTGRTRANISADDGSDGGGIRVTAVARNRKKVIAPVEDVMFMDDWGRRVSSGQLLQMVTTAQTLLPSSAQGGIKLAPCADVAVISADVITVGAAACRPWCNGCQPASTAGNKPHRGVSTSARVRLRGFVLDL